MATVSRPLGKGSDLRTEELDTVEQIRGGLMSRMIHLYSRGSLDVCC